MDAIAKGEDVDEAIKALDDAEGSNPVDQESVDDAVEDFRREISVLKSLRHPYVSREHRVVDQSVFGNPFSNSYFCLPLDILCLCWPIRQQRITNVSFPSS